MYISNGSLYICSLEENSAVEFRNVIISISNIMPAKKKAAKKTAKRKVAKKVAKKTTKRKTAAKRK